VEVGNSTRKLHVGGLSFGAVVGFSGADLVGCGGAHQLYHTHFPNDERRRFNFRCPDSGGNTKSPGSTARITKEAMSNN